MKVICLDFGNTLCKSAKIENDVIIETSKFLVKNLLSIVQGMFQDFDATQCIISSVIDVPTEVLNFLMHRASILQLSHDTKLPFINKYESPLTLGLDRLALIAQASAQFPNQNTLVICAGTCVTYNFMNQYNEFIGGSISPGLQMRLKAMNYFTKKLPLAENKQTPALIGTNTIASLQSGAIIGLQAEVEGIIQQYESKFQKINVVLTGGDMPQLAVLLKSRIFADADFLFKGLHTILQFHNS